MSVCQELDAVTCNTSEVSEINQEPQKAYKDWFSRSTFCDKPLTVQQHLRCRSWARWASSSNS